MFDDAIASRLPDLQGYAESLMILTFSAFKPNGTTVVDGLKVQAYELQPFTVEIDGTPGKIQGGSSSTADTAVEYVLIGSVRRPLLRGGLHIPISAPIPKPGNQGVGWEYLCTAVGAPGDQALVGRRYLVWSAPAKAYATARRLDVVEIS